LPNSIFSNYGDSNETFSTVKQHSTLIKGNISRRIYYSLNRKYDIKVLKLDLEKKKLVSDLIRCLVDENTLGYKQTRVFRMALYAKISILSYTIILAWTTEGPNPCNHHARFGSHFLDNGF
jgi:hypothetical protein